VFEKIIEAINELFAEKERLKRQRKILMYYLEQQKKDGNYYMLTSPSALSYLEKLKADNNMKEYKEKFEYFDSTDKVGSFPYELGQTLDMYGGLRTGIIGYFAINNDENNEDLETIFSKGIDITKYLGEANSFDTVNFRKDFKLIYELVEGIPFIKNPPHDNFRQGILLLLERSELTERQTIYNKSFFEENNGRYYLSPEYILGYVSVDENSNCQYIAKGHNYEKADMKTKKIGVKK